MPAIPRAELSDALEAAETVSPVDAVGAVTRRLAAALGTDRVAFLIADLAGRALVRLGRGELGGAHARRLDDESAATLPLDDGLVGQVLVDQRTLTVSTPDGWRMLAPVSQRGEVIGLLEVFVDSEPAAEQARAVERAAHILAFVVIANRRHTDLFEWVSAPPASS